MNIQVINSSNRWSCVVVSCEDTKNTEVSVTHYIDRSRVPEQVEYTELYYPDEKKVKLSPKSIETIKGLLLDWNANRCTCWRTIYGEDGTETCVRLRSIPLTNTIKIGIGGGCWVYKKGDSIMEFIEALHWDLHKSENVGDD